jgi:hypothetical protein
VVAPKIIRDLVAQYAANPAHYQASTFKETPTRQQFIDPFFEALGWNVTSKGLSEAEKEVVLEQTLSVGGSSKSIDYAFRLDGAIKFITEAKPPHKNLAVDKAPAIQVRRYGWNLGAPLGIVTDFEEFAVYDCRVQPDRNDGVKVARIEYIRYDEYDTRWDWIESLFSRDAVLAGSIDTWAATEKKRKGTVPVDAAFLVSINRWRTDLADDLVRLNPAITNDELNFAVQATIDRIVFLRICEDRGLEREGDLLDTTHQPNIYRQLLDVFTRADMRYNSGLFHFQKEKDRNAPDVLTPNLTIGDNVLRSIITGMYGPRNVFEYRIIPTDILGRVYEQFLGRVVVRKGNATEVVEKPEVRKAGGVYYTPEWVVDYIVQETLGPMLTNGSLADVARLTIVDPACGSGSFLLGAFEHLMNWHLHHYTSNKPEKYKKQVARDQFGNWRLTLDERRRILLNNIYGVDIDPQAVEVAKLSLLLKVIEGENQLAFALGRLLPDLDGNIKQGNSLVGSDLYTNIDVSTLTTDQMATLVPFDWDIEFPDVMADGGFDAVVGNPPYLNIDAVWGNKDPRLAYLKSAYADTYNDKTDLLFYFLNRAVELSKREVSMIVSRAFLEAFKANRLRQWLSVNSKVREIVDFQNAYVFEGVDITTAIVRFTHRKRPGKAQVRQFRPDEIPSKIAPRVVRDSSLFRSYDVDQKRFGAESWTFGTADELAVYRKLDRATAIGQVLHVGKGMETGANSVFAVTSTEAVSWGLPDEAWFLRARNSDIQRWAIHKGGPVILYPEAFPSWDEVPSGMQDHLEARQEVLQARAAFKRGNCDWWRFTWPLHSSFNDRPRILSPYLATSNRFALDESRGFLGLTDTTILYDNSQPEDLRWFVGFLNSKALTFRVRGIAKLKSNDIREYFENTVRQLPVPRAKPTDADHAKMVKLVNDAMATTAAISASSTQHDQKMWQAKLIGIEKAIDGIVYSSYGLTQGEIDIIEAAV